MVSPEHLGPQVAYADSEKQNTMNGLGPSRKQVKAPGLTRSNRVTSVMNLPAMSSAGSPPSLPPPLVVLYTLKCHRNQTPGPTVHQNICGGLAEIHWLSFPKADNPRPKQFGVEIIERPLRAMNCPYRATDSSGQNHSESLYEEPTYRFVANRHPP